MELIIGGAYQGKREYILRERGLSVKDIADGAVCSAADFFTHPVIDRLHAFGLRDLPENGMSGLKELIEKTAAANPSVIILCDEIGSGIVPIDPAEREYREAVGNLTRMIAEKAERVVRVHAGIPQVIKGEPNLRILLMRHSITEGNLVKRYIGITDQPLCREGIALVEDNIKAGVYPPVVKVYVSPLSRARETAALIWPNHIPEVTEGFRECDFGHFENRNYLEMEDDPEYQAWIVKGGMSAFPGGDDSEEFIARTVRTFIETVDKALALAPGPVAIMAHGGTVMSVLSELARPKKKFYEWYAENARGFEIEIVPSEWRRGCRELRQVRPV